MSRRDGRWVLTCRIGNARGNFLYNPEIRLAYLFPALTQEGERLWDVRTPSPLLMCKPCCRTWGFHGRDSGRAWWLRWCGRTQLMPGSSVPVCWLCLR